MTLSEKEPGITINIVIQKKKQSPSRVFSHKTRFPQPDEKKKHTGSPRPNVIPQLIIRARSLHYLSFYNFIVSRRKALEIDRKILTEGKHVCRVQAPPSSASSRSWRVHVTHARAFSRDEKKGARRISVPSEGEEGKEGGSNCY